MNRPRLALTASYLVALLALYAMGAIVRALVAA